MSDEEVKPAMPAEPSIPPLPVDPASLSTLTQPLAALPPSSESERVPLGRLSGIEIQNFLAFRGTFRLDLPKGENLLVYGENGAGKSSLFHALRLFMEAPDIWVAKVESTDEAGSIPALRPLSLDDNQHRFTKDAPSLKLEFSGPRFEWSKEKNETGDERVRMLNRGKGFLDYKALLEIHYVRSVEKQEIDLFPLLIQSLLPHYTYSHRGTAQTYKDGWAALQKEVNRTWRGNRRNREPDRNFRADLREFNEALEKTITDLGARASTMLATFGDEFQVELRFVKGEFKRNPKRIEGVKVLALPAFRKLQCPDYQTFLNEARLSALALCLFFAALKQSPATGLRLLALDDILIGLDMANRVKVIDLVRDNFKDWQIIILTYSKAWFERLKDYLHTSDWTPSWKSFVLLEEWRTEDNSPHGVAKDNSPHIIAEGSGTLIEMANYHLLHKDYKAAAVYARTALEALCHYTCARANLLVIHVTNAKQRQLEDLIVVLEARLGQLKDVSKRETATKLLARLREAQAFVLNRNSHFDVEEEDTLSGEVKVAIQTVTEFADFFEKLSWKNANFDDGQRLPAGEAMKIELAEAHKLARFGPKVDAIKKMAAAHHLAWEAFAILQKVAIPVGQSLNAKTIWTAAQAQGRLDSAFDERLKKARPYLFGCLKAKDFDAAKFEEAAKLLEEIAP